MASKPDENGLDKTRSFRVLARGTVISHYKILEKIGEGGMGVVYKAQDTKLDRIVALKFLPEQYTSDEGFKARFKREAQASAALNHPNIITIHEVAEYENRPYFAMEYIEGESLKDLIARKDLSINKVIDIATDRQRRSGENTRLWFGQGEKGCDVNADWHDRGHGCLYVARTSAWGGS